MQIAAPPPRLRIGDDFDVIASGSVLVPRSKSVDFEFTLDPAEPDKAPVILRLEFIKDPTTERGHYADKQRTEVFQGTSSRGEFQGLRLFNFLPAIGSGSRTPFQVGSLQGRELHFSFWSTPLGKGMIDLRYTFLLGAEVANV